MRAPPNSEPESVQPKELHLIFKLPTDPEESRRTQEIMGKCGCGCNRYLRGGVVRVTGEWYLEGHQPKAGSTPESKLHAGKKP
jgi:hypothetical protein